MATKTGSIDLKANKEASTKATNYIVDLSNGIFVHAEGTPADPTDSDAVGVGIKDSVDIVRNGEVVANYGEAVTIGKTDGTQSHLELDNRSFEMIDVAGDTYFNIEDLRDNNGQLTEISEADGGTWLYLDFTIEVVNNVPQCSVYVNNVLKTYQTDYTLQELGGRIIIFNTAPSTGSTIKVIYTPGADGIKEAKSFTYGSRTSDNTKNKYMSVAMGVDVEAYNYGQAFGKETLASAYSHAEGWGSQATGLRSHAEGYMTQATGQESHASGCGTIANDWGQTAIGRWNVEDTNLNQLFIIGNGSSVKRSNAFWVDANGLAGLIGLVSMLPEEKSDLNNCKGVQSQTGVTTVIGSDISIYKYTSAAANKPSAAGGILIVFRSSNTYYWQIALANSSSTVASTMPIFVRRTSSADNWIPWRSFTTAAI